MSAAQLLSRCTWWMLAGATLLATLPPSPAAAQATAAANRDEPSSAFPYDDFLAERPAAPPSHAFVTDADEPSIAGLSDTPTQGPAAASGRSAVIVSDAPDAVSADDWTWQVLPNGLLYPAYLAGVKESRLGSQMVYVPGHGWFWDFTTGGHVGLLRWGSNDPFRPEGWQLDAEGAAFPRLDLEREGELRSTDFRGGFPLTYRSGPWEAKFAYYHLCAHLGDLLLRDDPSFPRITYVRDALVLGATLRPWPEVRVYCEVGYAVHVQGLAKPWEVQFGTEYSSIEPTGPRGSPFAAVNGHLTEDNHFSGNVTLQTGWQWRGDSGHLLRVGLHWFNGMSEQHQFFATFESQVGIGLWYDF